VNRLSSPVVSDDFSDDFLRMLPPFTSFSIRRFSRTTSEYKDYTLAKFLRQAVKVLPERQGTSH
jgi:hypothetical protein